MGNNYKINPILTRTKVDCIKIYHRMMDCFNLVFEGAIGKRTVLESSVVSGTDPPPARGGTIFLRRAQP